jgi:hypothetical protein
VQDGLSLLEAEVLCAMKIADISRPATPPAPGPGPEPRVGAKRRRDARQLALKF